MNERLLIMSMNVDKRVTNMAKILQQVVNHRPTMLLIQDPPKEFGTWALAFDRLGYQAAAAANPGRHNDWNLNYNNIIMISKEHNEASDPQGTATIFNATNSTLGVILKMQTTTTTTTNNNNSTSASYAIVSIYIRPRTPFAELKATLDRIEQDTRASVGLSRLMVVGDMNATDTEWASNEEVAPELDAASRVKSQLGTGHYKQMKLTRGRFISNTLNKLKLTCLNDPNDPKGLLKTSQSQVDVAYAGKKALRRWGKQRFVDLGAEHRLMIIEAPGRSDNNNSVNVTTNSYDDRTIQTKYQWHKLSEQHFMGIKHELNKLRTNLKQMSQRQLRERAEQMTGTLIEGLLRAQEAIKRPTPTNKNTTPTTLTAHLRLRLTKLTKRAEQIRAKIHKNRRHRCVGRNKDAKLRRTTRLTLALKRAQNRLRDEIERSLVPSDALGEHGMDPWARLKNIKRMMEREQLKPTKIVSQQNHHAEAGKSNSNDINNNAVITQESLERIAEENFGPIVEGDETGSGNFRRKTTRRDDDNNSKSQRGQEHRQGHMQTTAHTHEGNDNDEQLLDISQQEVLDALKLAKNKRCTGPEGLRYQTLLIAAKYIQEALFTWCWTCFRASYTPSACKMTRGVIIPKKTPGKFRIVHIGSPLTSLLERIALSRLDFLLEQRNLFSKRQFGFSALIGRQDLIARVLELAIRNCMREPTGADKNPKLRRHTTVVGFDIKGAFDNVNQDIIQQKVIQSLEPDPLRWWLANFIKDRRIRLKHEGLTSKSRQIQRGVPQGSILGPVLWNLTINQIDETVSKPDGEVELLAYADDLVLVQLDNNQQELQGRVDILNKCIRALGLEIAPDKCILTRLRLATDRQNNSSKTNNNSLVKTFVNGLPIQSANSITILGMPITHQLRLDLNDCKHRINSKNTMKILNTLHRLNVIHTSKEWYTLINGLLISTTALNYTPLMAVDRRAREWCDKIITRTLKKIFDWPSNASDKATRLLTNINCNTESLVSKAIETQMAKPNGESYRLIYELMKQGGNVEALKRQNIPTSVEQLSLKGHIRRHYNPELAAKLRIDPKPYKLMADLFQAKGPVWVIIESDLAAMAAEVIHLEVLSIHTRRHSELPRAYYNMLGIVWELANHPKAENKTIALKESCSLVAAIHNMNNKDWRIIILREKLAAKDWSICLYNDGYDMEVKRQILDHKERHGFRTHKFKWTSWPDTSEPEAASRVRSNYTSEIKRLTANNYTSIIRMLTNGELTRWPCLGNGGNLNPSWISGKMTLMLSGIVLAGGRLRKGDLAAGETPHDCEEAVCSRRTNIATPETDATSRDRMKTPTETTWLNEHTTLHRAFHCKRGKFADPRRELRIVINRALSEEVTRRTDRKHFAPYSLREPWLSPMAIAYTLANPRTVQTLLRLLTEVALNNN